MHLLCRLTLVIFSSVYQSAQLFNNDGRTPVNASQHALLIRNITPTNYTPLYYSLSCHLLPSNSCTPRPWKWRGECSSSTCSAYFWGVEGL